MDTFSEGLDHPEFPHVTDELIRELDKRFPLVNPSFTDSERVIFFRAGIRRTIDFLKEQKQLQDESSLAKEMTR